MRLDRAALTAVGLAGLLVVIGTGFDAGTATNPPPVQAPNAPTTTTTPPPPTTPTAPSTTPDTTPTTTAPPPADDAAAPAVEEFDAAPPGPVAEHHTLDEPTPVEDIVEAPPAPAHHTPVSYAAATHSAPENDFFQLTNAARAAVGLPALRSDAGLHTYALGQAHAMAAAGSIYHSDISVLLGAWSTLGENVGVGPSISAIQDALLASPGHYANIVERTYTAVGVGVATDASGRVWTAHVFAA